jgi:zinc transport system substrate-binding protein
MTGVRMKIHAKKIFTVPTFFTALSCLFLIAGFPHRGLLHAGSDGKKTVEGLTLKVFAGIPPTAYFVERIGGEHVTVETLIEAGNDPHTYEPTPKKMMMLADADVYFGSGMPFEKQLLGKLIGSNPGLVFIETDKGIELNDSGHNSDPHIWLSPPLIKFQAEQILGGLAKLDPDNKESYEKYYRTFITDLNVVHENITKLLAPYRGRSFMVFHPAFGHFADAYGLVQTAIEIEGREPSPKQLEKTVKQAVKLGINTIFVEPQFDRKNAQVIADSIGADIVTLDPLKKNVLANLEDIARAIERSF